MGPALRRHRQLRKLVDAPVNRFEDRRALDFTERVP
jgi:hypothetical protein